MPISLRRDPGSTTAASQIVSIAVAMIVAAAISAAFLAAGFSPFDDATYAWMTRRIADGAVLHRDLAWAHPGYAQVLDVAFGKWLLADIVRFRWHLPLLAALTAASVAYLLRAKGTWVQWIAAAAIGGLGFAQFATPSSNWFAIAFAAMSVAIGSAAANADGRQRAPALAFAAGALAAIAFGCRTVNGVGAVAVLLIVLSHAATPQMERDAAPTRPMRWLAWFAGAVLAAIGAVVLATSNDISKLYLGAPLVLACAVSCVAVVRRANAHASRLYLLCGLGWLAGIAPLLLWWLHDGVASDAFADITSLAGSINQWQTARAVTIQDLLATSLEIAFYRDGVSPGSLTNMALMLIGALMSLLLILMGRRGGFADPAWLLAASMLFNIFSFPALLYLPYAIPFFACAALAWSRGRETTPLAAAVLALTVAAVFVSPRGMHPGSAASTLVSGRIESIECPLPKCSLRAEALGVDSLRRDYELLARTIPAGRPLAVLPDIATLGYFLPNPSPWHLPRLDETMPAAQVERFHREFARQPGAVVALKLDDYSRLGRIVSGYCLAGTVGGWGVLTACDATKRCQASTTLRWDPAVGQSVIADSFCALPPWR